MRSLASLLFTAERGSPSRSVPLRPDSHLHLFTDSVVSTEAIFTGRHLNFTTTYMRLDRCYLSHIRFLAPYFMVSPVSILDNANER